MISNYLRWGLIIISPLYLLNLYVQSAYNYSLANYGQWLFSPSENSDFSFGPFIITLALLAVCTFWFSLFINGMYVKLFGSKKDYAYLGNSAQFNGHYYRVSDPQKQTYQTAASDIEYNYSFDNIERKQSFTHEANLAQGLGSTTSQFSLGRLFTHLVVILFFIVPMLGTLHACFSAMSGELFTGSYNDNIFKYAWEDSFEITLNQFQVSLTQYYLSWVFLLFVMMFCFVKFPRQQFGARISPLPKSLTVGSTHKAIPVEITKILTTDVYNEFGQTKTKTVETTKRNVTFEFNHIFKKTVYVTAIVETKDKPKLESELISYIEQHTEQTLEITDNLGIKLIV